MAKTKEQEIARLREEREAISMQIIELQDSLRPISARIRELEGPIPDRSHRLGISYTISPAKE